MRLDPVTRLRSLAHARGAALARSFRGISDDLPLLCECEDG